MQDIASGPPPPQKVGGNLPPLLVWGLVRKVRSDAHPKNQSQADPSNGSENGMLEQSENLRGSVTVLHI